MARKPREKSQFGIYHVMLRGINKQDIFLDDNDFESMLKTIEASKHKFDRNGKIISSDCCSYYAYCILHNHLHLLIHEGTESVSEVMKKIQDRFVFIYNRKYERVGHLFQDRFASEAVNDINYFKQLIRYIHRNPVKAMEAQRPEDYKYSSWREYIIKGSDPLMMQICDTEKVLEKFEQDELIEWVNRNVDDDCMDMKSFAQPMSESEAAERLLSISRTESIEDFKQLSADIQIDSIKRLLDEGGALRQASRLSSLSYRALWNKLHPEEYKAQLEESRRNRKLKRASSRGLTP